MSVLEIEQSDGYLFFDERRCREAGKALHDRYVSAEPFPHIVLDEFLDPARLRGLTAGFPAIEGKGYFDRDQERLKYQFAPAEVQDGRLRNLLVELNSQAFLGFLEEMTGIDGLIPDPHYAGGGLHETRQGGHLSIHADFNIHAKMKLERRLNLIVYLNDEWEESYGGKLELWDKEMKACQVSVLPVLGRAVVFNTTLDSYHGQPDPLSCPPDRSRRSIATYYYSAMAENLTAVKDRNTTFQVRPGSGDKTDWQVRSAHFIGDWVPRRLQPIAHRLNPFR